MNQNFLPPKEKENKTYYFSIAAIVFIFILFESLLYLKGFYAISADESGHTLDAYYWFIGKGNFFSIWLPFQKIIYACAFHIYPDLFLVPRIISLLFGVFALLALIDLSLQLFNNRTISIITGFLGILFLPLTIFSVLPLAEIYFFFFTLASLTFYLRWKKHERNIYLWLAVLFSVIGTTTRYEAWLFTFHFFLLISSQIFKQKKSFQDKILLTAGIAVLLSFFPLFWIYLSYLSTGKIAGFMLSVVDRYHPLSLLSRLQNNVLYKFLMVNIQSLNIIGIISLIYLFRKDSSIKEFSILFVSTLIVFAFVTFITHAMPTHNFWRLAMIWSLLLLPFTSRCIYFLIEKVPSIKISYTTFILSFIILTFLFGRQTISHSFYSFISKDDLNVGRFIRQIDKEKKSNAYLERSGTWDYTSVLVTSNHPDRIITKLNSLNSIFYDTLFVNDKLKSELKSLDIDYLILNPYTKICPGKTKLDEVKRLTLWKVYKIQN